MHVAEIDSFLRAHQAFGAQPLSSPDADRYVEQTAVAASLLGVPGPPTDVVGLRRVLESYRPQLEATAAAREAARFLLLDPPLPLVARPGYGMLASGGVSLLPDWARAMLGIPVPGFMARSLAHPLGLVGTAAVRWGMSGVEDRRAVAASAARERAGLDRSRTGTVQHGAVP